MRANCYVEQEEVVAIVMEDMANVITSSCSLVKEAIERRQMGWTKKVSKDFLPSGSSDTKICRGSNVHKRKCYAVKLSVLPEDLKREIKESELHSLFHVHNCSTVTHTDTEGLMKTPFPGEANSKGRVKLLFPASYTLFLLLNIIYPAPMYY